MTMQLPEYAEQDTIAPVGAIRTFFAGIGQPRVAGYQAGRGGRHGAVPGQRTADRSWPEPGSPEPGSPEPDAAAPHAATSTAATSAAAAPGSPGSPASARTPAGSARTGRAGRSRSARRRGAIPDRDPRWPSLNLTNNVRLLSDDDLAHLPAADPPAIAMWAAAGQSPRPDGSRPAADARPAQSFAPTRGSRPLDPTNNVRLLSPEDLAARAASPRSERSTPAWEPPAPAAERPITPDERSALPGRVNPASLPISGYDALSLPALRARLRGLDQAQLRVLLDYERASAGRPEVITMFERRIDKLRADRS